MQECLSNLARTVRLMHGIIVMLNQRVKWLEAKMEPECQDSASPT